MQWTPTVLVEGGVSYLLMFKCTWIQIKGWLSSSVQYQVLRKGMQTAEGHPYIYLGHLNQLLVYLGMPWPPPPPYQNYGEWCLRALREKLLHVYLIVCPLWNLASTKLLHDLRSGVLDARIHIQGVTLPESCWYPSLRLRNGRSPPIERPDARWMYHISWTVGKFPLSIKHKGGWKTKMNV